MKTWNYQNNLNKPVLQNDWNQTLVSTFNEIVFENNVHIRPIFILSPSKFKSIFETILYYSKEYQTITSKYTIIYSNEDINIIKVALCDIDSYGKVIYTGGYQLEILNFK